MAKYVGLWYGGSNYASPDPEKDAESFDSIAQASRVLQAREDGDRYYPCVEASEMHLYRGEYSENGPDIVLTIGKRGGVKRS